MVELEVEGGCCRYLALSVLVVLVLQEQVSVLVAVEAALAFPYQCASAILSEDTLVQTTANHPRGWAWVALGVEFDLAKDRVFVLLKVHPQLFGDSSVFLDVPAHIVFPSPLPIPIASPDL
jgi:hypothetical protein